jgi:anion-transporting  ArsA/GET3 family ATPase
LRAAEAGRKVVVLTIDPARRLAQSLGVGELDNTPRPVPMIDTAAGGSLDAMMLDMKNTFDDVVIAHSTPEKAEAILQNQFYVALSSEFSGTQEYMAMEKLGQLHSEAEANGTWDLIVVDTPPARSALDFLDAPEHLSSLLDGRFLRLLLPAGTRPAAFDECRLLHDVGGGHQDPRLPDHQRREDLRSRVRGTLRWIPAARDGNLPAVVLAAQYVPGRRHAAA